MKRTTTCLPTSPGCRMYMLAMLAAVSLAFAGLALGSPPLVCADASYSLVSSGSHFQIHVNDEYEIPDAYLGLLNEYLEMAYAAYLAMGLEAPNDGAAVEVYVSDDLAAGTGLTEHGAICFNHDTAEADIPKVTAHELFHSFQHQMFGGPGRDLMLLEGMAHWAEGTPSQAHDQINGNAVNFFSRMWDRPMMRAFFVFFHYLSEQYTAHDDVADPAYGSDVIVSLFRSFKTISLREGRSPTLARDMDEALTALRGCTLRMKQVYQDYLIAAFAKDLDDPFLGGEYSQRSGLPRWDFLEDEEYPYAALGFKSSDDTLSDGRTLVYDNAATGFSEYGHAAHYRITLGPRLGGVAFSPFSVDGDSIHYVAALQYVTRDGVAVRKIAGLDSHSDADIALYTSEFPAKAYRARYLIVIPFTLDDDPSDGGGDNYAFAVTGLKVLPSAFAPPFYAVDEVCDCLYRVSADGTVRAVGDLAQGKDEDFRVPTSMAVDRDGTLYVVDGAAGRLLWVDPVSGDATAVGTGALPDLGGLAINSVAVASAGGQTYPAGTLFGAAESLYVIDKSTGDILAKVGDIGVAPSGTIQGLAFRSDGTLFAAEARGEDCDRLLRVSTKTGAGAEVGVIAPEFAPISALLFDPGDRLWAASQGRAQLVEINDEDAAVIRSIALKVPHHVPLPGTIATREFAGVRLDLPGRQLYVPRGLGYLPRPGRP